MKTFMDTVSSGFVNNFLKMATKLGHVFLGVRTNLTAWSNKLDCGGDLEKQNHFKKQFIKRLQNSPVAIETDKANEQHYEVPTEFFTTVYILFSLSDQNKLKHLLTIKLSQF